MIGVYFIHGQANFASNKTGLRRLELKNNNVNGLFGGTQAGASGSGKTDVQVVGISGSTFAAREKGNKSFLIYSPNKIAVLL